MRSARILFAVWMLALVVPAGAAEYAILELPPLPPQEGIPTGAFDISENGYVAGYSGSGGSQRSVRWTVTPASVSAPLNVTSGVAYGVNDHGNVVGSMPGPQAFFWRANSSSLWMIPTCKSKPGGSGKPVSAYAINNSNEVVGFYSPSVPGNGTFVQPGWGFFWNSTWTQIRLLDSSWRSTLGSAAYAITNLPEGAVAGAAEVSPSGSVVAVQQAHGWVPTPGGPDCLPAEPGQPLDALPIPEGPGSSVAYGINELGQEVGESNGIAVRFPGPEPLGVLGAARDINNAGQIVGYVNSPVQYAFIHENGLVRNLNDLIPPNTGWSLLQAYGINDDGWIVGIGLKGVYSGTGGSGGTGGAGGADLTGGVSRSRTQGSMTPGDPSGTPNVIRGFVLIPLAP